MLTLKELDLESDKSLQQNLHEKDRVDAINEMKHTREVLGTMSVRDSVEAIYGEAYAQQILGDDGGKDVLVEDLNPHDDCRESMGLDRLDVGDNRMKTRKINELNKNDREELSNALNEQEQVADQGVENSIKEFYEEDSKLYKNQKIDGNILP